ncbi:MAG: acylphosphatase [Euryarchaeota archaeon RBG_16_68_13]|nr:MAG: acylphosphatase [Euryarchaeota archaeon RBG_16_68_13]
MRVRALAVFRGRVQGVYFRAHCEEKASQLGLAGYVRNRPDGAVEAVFEGERGAVEACIEWNRASQPYASVDSVEVVWSPPTDEFHGFQVTR